MRLFVPQRLVKRQSKYRPHQGKRERVRRLRNFIKRGGRQHPQDDWMLPAEAAAQLLALLK